MLIINRPQTDPYFNIAAEEYLLKNMEKNCFMLWQNESCVVVGKHQNTLAEINYQLVSENKIPVIRRISGGGTVFHDTGNLNFTFISKGEREKLVNFRKFIDPVVTVLDQLGVPAEFSGKSDIRVNGLKISGNSEHVYHDRVLHHGTLLFSTELSRLEQVLKVSPDKFRDKGVKSLRSTVGNIAEFLDKRITVEEFKHLLLYQMMQTMNTVEFRDLTKEEIAAIRVLADQKYSSWEWNFGYSPDYRLFQTVVDEKKVKWAVDIEVKKGIITDITLFKDELHFESNQFIAKLLKSKKHKFADLNDFVRENQIQFISMGLTPEVVLNLLF
jgi:lipoate---protein ligase